MSRPTDGSLLGRGFCCFILIALMLLLFGAGAALAGIGANCLYSLDFVLCSGLNSSSIAMVVCGSVLIVGSVVVIAISPSLFCGVGICCNERKRTEPNI
jgi:hypothetical protein